MIRRALLSGHSVLLLSLANLFVLWLFSPRIVGSRNLANVSSNMWPLLTLVIGQMFVLGVPYPIALFTLVVVVTWMILNRTTLGRQTYAVGHSIENARKAGIHTNRIQAIVYEIRSFIK